MSKPDILAELKSLKLHGMAQGYAELIEHGGLAILDDSHWMIEPPNMALGGIDPNAKTGTGRFAPLMSTVTNGGITRVGISLTMRCVTTGIAPKAPRAWRGTMQSTQPRRLGIALSAPFQVMQTEMATDWLDSVAIVKKRGAEGRPSFLA